MSWLASQTSSTAHTVLPLHPVFLITATSSFFCMETQVVPQINTIKLSGQLIFVQHSHNTPNQRKQPPKHISGGPCACVCVCVRERERARERERESRNWRGHSILTSSYVTLFLIHSILRTDPFCSPLQLVFQTLTQKKKIIGRVEKTKLITQGISTSQCCLKCNYMGLELWLRLGWLQISHRQTVSQCRIGLLLKMTAGGRHGVDEEMSIMTLSTTWKEVEKKSRLSELDRQMIPFTTGENT